MARNWKMVSKKRSLPQCSFWYQTRFHTRLRSKIARTFSVTSRRKSSLRQDNVVVGSVCYWFKRVGKWSMLHDSEKKIVYLFKFLFLLHQVSSRVSQIVEKTWQCSRYIWGRIGVWQRLMLKERKVVLTTLKFYSFTHFSWDWFAVRHLLRFI